MWNYYHKNVPEEPTLDPSQTLGWNANGQDKDTNRHGYSAEEKEVPREIGKDTQESLDEIDRIAGRMEIRRQKMRKKEEERANKIKRELEDLVR